MIETNTLATVHQRLRDEHGVAASESSLRRYVGQAFPDRRSRPVTVLRPGAPVGEAQIDYGYLGSWVDPVGGWPAAAGAGVRDRAGLLPAHVRAAGAELGPVPVGGRARGG